MDNQQLHNQQLQNEKNFKTIGYSLFGMLLAVIVSQIFFSLFLVTAFPGIEYSIWFETLLISIPFYLVGVPVFLAIINKVPSQEKGPKKNLSFKQMIILFFVSMGTTYVFNFVGNIINQIIEGIKGSEVINPLDTVIDLSNIVPLIIVVVILTPIIEEFVFRGVLLDKLRRFGDKTAIIFTALVFGLFHGNFSQFFYAFALGLIFAYITIKTNTIRYSIVLHMLVNLFGSVIMPMLVLGGDGTSLAIAGFLVLLFLIVGTVLFFKNLKKVKKDIKESYGGEDLNTDKLYNNRGMILFYALVTTTFLSNIMG